MQVQKDTLKVRTGALAERLKKLEKEYMQAEWDALQVDLQAILTDLIQCSDDEYSLDGQQCVSQIVRPSLSMLLGRQTEQATSELLRTALRLWLAKGDAQHPNICMLLELLLDPKGKYYSKELLINGIQVAVNDQLLKNLQVSQKVDVLSFRQGSIGAWLQASVSLIGENFVKVTLQDGYVETVPKNGRLQPLESQSSGYAWRKALKQRDTVDAYHSAQVWLPSTIIEKNDWNIEVGYRLYHKRQSFSDELYIGQSSRHDVKMSVLDPRIRPLDSISKGYYRQATKKQNQKHVNDSNDELYTKQFQKSGQVVIHRDQYTISTKLIDLLTLFNKQDGFQKILERLPDKEMTPQVMESLLNIFFRLSDNFTLQFCKTYIPKLKDIAWVALVECSDAFIRKMGRDTIKSIMQDLSTFLLRILNPPDRDEWMDHLTMEVAKRCLFSQYLQRKIQALKIFDDHIKIIDKNRTYKDKQTFIDWVLQHDLLDEIFRSNAHQQVIARSQQFFAFTLETLPSAKFRCLWQQFISEDFNLRDVAFKVIHQSIKKLRQSHLDIIFNSLEQIKTPGITEELLNLLLDNLVKEEQQLKALMFLWCRLMENSRQFRPKMKEKTVEKFTYTVRLLIYPSELVNKLLCDATKRPISKTAISLIREGISSCKYLTSKALQEFQQYLINTLQTLPEKKYNMLNKIFDLLIEVEDQLSRLPSEMQDKIINAIKPEGASQLLAYLLKRKSQKIVFKPVEHLTVESFKMLLQLFEKKMVSWDEDPRKVQFYEYVKTALEHQNQDMQNLACDFISLLYIKNFQQNGHQHLKPFIEECLLKNTRVYHRLLRQIIEGTQTDWVEATLSTAVAPTTEIQITIMNQILVCKDNSRSFHFKLQCNQTLRHILSFLAMKTELSIYELKLTRNHHEFKQSDSIKSVFELGIRENTIIHLGKKQANKKPILNKKRQLTPAATKIFTQVFSKQLQECGSLSSITKDQYRKIYQKYSLYSTPIEESKLEMFFNGKQTIQLQDFLKIYQKQSHPNDIFVRKIIQRMGYSSTTLTKANGGQETYNSPSHLVMKMSGVHERLFQTAHKSQSVQEQKQIVDLMLRLPIYIIPFLQQEPQQLMKILKEEQNLFRVWHHFSVIKYILKKQPLADYYLGLTTQQLDQWTKIFQEDQVDLIVEQLLKRVWNSPNNYIRIFLIQDLVMLLHQRIVGGMCKKYQWLKGLLPQFENLKQPLFVPKVEVPKEKHLGSLLSWITPQQSFPIHINEFIYQILMVCLILGDGDAWQLPKPISSYKFQKSHLWCLSLSLWKGKTPPGGLESLLKNNQYDLAAFIIKNYSKTLISQGEKLALCMISEVLQYESTEKRNVQGVDWKLVGQLQVLQALMVVNEGELAKCYGNLSQSILYSFLFPKNLFEEGKTQQIKCYSRQSRKKAVEMVISLLKYNPKQNRQFIIDFVSKLTNKIPTPLRIDRRQSPIRSELGFVGLRNLGATCYMNAVLQQLFNCQSLRKVLLAAEGDSPFLEELKKMLHYLQLSERMDLEPSDFFRHVRMGGQSAPTNVQQDAHQFLNFFFDEVEKSSSNRPYKQILEEMCCGQFVNLMTCQGCGHVKKTHDKFYDISLEVKNKTTLQESLQKLTEGEVINDYLCEKCQNRNNVHRRILLEHLPNHLTISLQRIIFDLDTLTNKKIHSKLQFPEQLDLYNYSKEHMDDQERKATMEDEERRHDHHTSMDYHYKLRGIVIHLGAAEAGHYYSLVRHDGQWLLFDDSRLSKFQESLAQQCFGGSQRQQWAENVDYSKNAYMLMYERVKVKTLKIEDVGEQAQRLRPLLGSMVDREFPEDPIIIKQSQLQLVKTENYVKEVERDNERLIRENILLGPELTELISTSIKQIEYPALENSPYIAPYPLSEDNKVLVDILFNFLVDYIFRAGELMEIDTRLVPDLVWIIRVQPEYARTLLRDSLKTECVLAQWRDYRVQLKVLWQWALGIDICMENSTMTKLSEASLDALLDNMDGDVAKNWNRASEYFELIKDLMNQMQQLLIYFMQKDIISRVCHFIMDKESPVDSADKKHPLGTAIIPWSFVHIAQIILIALRRHNTLTDQAVEHDPPIMLTDTAKKCLKSIKIFKRLLKDPNTSFCVASILVYSCFNNLEYTEIVVQLLLQTLSSVFSFDDFFLHSPILLQLLSTNDTITQQKLEMLLGFPLLAINSQGCFGLTTNITNQIFTYPSTILNSEGKPMKSLLDLLFKQKHEYKPYMIYGIQCLLNCCLSYDHVFNYVISLPAPTYYFSNYFQWMDEYIRDFNSQSYKHSRNDFNAAEIGQATYQTYLKLKQKVSDAINKNIETISKMSQRFSNRMGTKWEAPKQQYGVERFFKKQYIYGLTKAIKKIEEKTVEQNLVLHVFDHYVWKMPSKPSITNNQCFPFYLTDSRGKIDPSELNRYPEMLKYVHAKKNSLSRYELVEEQQQDPIMSFQPIFSTQKSMEKKREYVAQLPIPYESEQEMPPNETAIIRCFFLVNKTNQNIWVRVKPVKDLILYLPSQLQCVVNQGQTRIVMISLEQNQVELQIMKRQVAMAPVMMVEEEKQVTASTAMQYYDFPPDVVNCPKCTYQNKITDTKCSMCDSEF